MVCTWRRGGAGLQTQAARRQLCPFARAAGALRARTLSRLPEGPSPFAFPIQSARKQALLLRPTRDGIAALLEGSSSLLAGGGFFSGGVVEKERYWFACAPGVGRPR